MSSARCVLLRHDLPEGSWHYDWMLQIPGCEGAGRLMTFRVRVRVDSDAWLEFEGVALGDHRAEYLEYEGPVSGGRGVVRRVARGEVIRGERATGSLDVTVDWGGGAVRWIGAEGVGRDGLWRFVRRA